MRLFLGFAVLTLLSIVNGFPSFQNKIPNGKNVPHPCKDGMWVGVGHENELGGGNRNPFGMAFKKTGMVWNAVLCQLDSDVDGKTNGEELGDPNCVWTEGATPAGPALSHPGICDPFTSGQCDGRNKFVSCGEAAVCPGLDDTATISRTYRFPETVVPAEKTTYMCMTFELPSDQDLHFFATKPYIDTVDIVHHILVYGCDVSTAEELSRPLNTPYKCGMSGEARCSSLIDLWAVGASGSCAHPDVGFRVGTNGLKFATMEMHWNNPYKQSGYVDSSGITMYFTPNLRPNDAAIVMIGQNYLEIPPDEYWHEEKSTCTPQCMGKVFSGTVYATETLNHMHYLGFQQKTSVYRDGEKVRDLAFDKEYDFESPVKTSLSDPVMIKRTDELKTSCIFQSISRNKTTFYGEGSLDEMCFAFITVYPAEKVLRNVCSAWKTIDFCDFEDQIVQGCNIATFATDAAILGAKIFQDCDINGLSCRKECKKTVRETQQHACMQGDIGKYMEGAVLIGTEDPLQKIQAYQFYAGFHSCDVEFARTSVQTSDGRPSALCPAVITLLASFLLITLGVN